MKTTVNLFNFSFFVLRYRETYAMPLTCNWKHHLQHLLRSNIFWPSTFISFLLIYIFSFMAANLSVIFHFLLRNVILTNPIYCSALFPLTTLFRCKQNIYILYKYTFTYTRAHVLWNANR